MVHRAVIRILVNNSVMTSSEENMSITSDVHNDLTRVISAHKIIKDYERKWFINKEVNVVACRLMNINSVLQGHYQHCENIYGYKLHPARGS